MDLARADRIGLFASAILLAELEDVLNRKKFAERLAFANISARELVLGYAALALVIAPAIISPVILADPADDAVLACAAAANAEAIVSGDTDLLSLKEYKSIKIFSTIQLLAQFEHS